MQKYKHLHDKIRSVRKSLGLKQSEFITKVSEQLGLEKPLSPGLVSQWESRRSTPRPEHIAAIAKLTSNPWWNMCWFMHDDLEEGRGVDYHQDGSFVLAPSYTDSEIEDVYREMIKEKNAPPNPEIITWMNDPNKIQDLRQDLAKRHAAEIGATSKITETLESQNINNISVEIVGVQGKTAVGRLSTSGNSEKIQGLFAITPPVIDDYVYFPTKKHKWSNEASEQKSLSAVDETDDRNARSKKFDGTLQYFLEEQCGYGDVEYGFNRAISAGVIKCFPYFYLHGVSVQLTMLTPGMTIGAAAGRIRRTLADLILIDRIQNRSAKKMILFAFYENDLDLTNLTERFDKHIKSAETLGVTVAFASGPMSAAVKIAELIESFKDPV